MSTLNEEYLYLSNDEKWEKYGKPVRLEDDEENVVVFAHESKLSAELSAHANREQYHHPSWVDERDGQWVCVIDLNPAILEAQKLWERSEGEPT
jgi:hypothetical protein